MVALRTCHDLVEQVWKSSTQRVVSVKGVGMMLSIMLDIVVAARLGTGQATDALIIGTSVPLLIDVVVREGTKFSLVALLVENTSAVSEVEYQDFVSGLLNFAVVMGLFCTVLVWFSAPLVVPMLGPGMAAETKAEAIAILRIAVPVILFALAATVLGVMLNAQRRFAVVALRSVIIPSAILLVVAVTWQTQRVTRWIAIGYLAGFASVCGVLAIAAQGTGFRHSWRTWPKVRDLKRICHSVSLPILGFIALQVARVMERRFASSVAIGGVAAYYFAFRIFSAVQTLIGVSIATTSLPTLTEHSLSNDRIRVSTTLRRRLLWAVIPSLAIAVLVLLFNDSVVSLMYGRGSFDQESIRGTSGVLARLALGIVFLTLTPILNSALFAERAYGLAFQNMVAVAIANVGLAWVLSQWWGINGIALATSLSMALGVANSVRLLYQKGISLSVSSNRSWRGQ